MSLTNLIRTTARCVLCNAQGVGSCGCWIRCRQCGYSFEVGTRCGSCDPFSPWFENAHDIRLSLKDGGDLDRKVLAQILGPTFEWYEMGYSPEEAICGLLSHKAAP